MRRGACLRDRSRVLRRFMCRYSNERRALRTLRQRVRARRDVQRWHVHESSTRVFARVRRDARRALRRARGVRVRRVGGAVSGRAGLHCGSLRSGVSGGMPRRRGVYGARVRLRSDGLDVPRWHHVPQRSLPRPGRLRSALRRRHHVLRGALREYRDGHEPLRLVWHALHADPRALLRAVWPRLSWLHAGAVLRLTSRPRTPQRDA
jgi:hypothetical protein